jgi:outer membrane protein assembly factor BamB
LVTVALDAATGRQRWRREAPAVELETVHEWNTTATPTPCADAERLYVYFGSYGLIAYDLGGEERWRRPIPPPKSLYGSATSPILYRDLVIVVLDNDANLPGSKLSQSRIVAVHKGTGEVAWEAARPLVRSGWSTPAVWERPEGDELVVLGNGRLSGHDLSTGAERWFVTGFARETIAVPVFGNGLVYAASAMGGLANETLDPAPLWKAMLHFDANGDGRIGRDEITEHFTFPLRPEVPPGHPGFGLPLPADPQRRRERQSGIFASIDKDKDGIWTREEFAANLGPARFRPRLVAVRPGGQGDVSTTHVAWELTRSIPEIPSPLAHRDRLYMVRNGGILTLVDAVTGRVLYDERLGPEAGGQYSASPVAAGGHLFVVSNQGVASVVALGDTFRLVHQRALGESVHVTPVPDGDAIYFRTASGVRSYVRPRP